MSIQQAAIGLGDTILRRASITPTARALTFEGQTLTCAELGERVRRLATYIDLESPKGIGLAILA